MCILISNDLAGVCKQVARCTKIISPNTEEAKYVINVKQIAKVYLCIPQICYCTYFSFPIFVPRVGEGLFVFI